MAVELTEHIVATLKQLEAAGIQGAAELLRRICKAESESARIRANTWTEGFAVWFASRKLGFEIRQIEQNGDIPSPFRRTNQSCDIYCIDKSGREVFVETKDRSSDLLKAESSGRGGYTPQMPSEVQAWLSRRVFDCIQKGATLMIGRIPTYTPITRPSDQRDIHFEVFGSHVGQSEVVLEIAEEIPSHFAGVWLIKNGYEAFYSVRRKQMSP